jgi:hypothetical protein
VSSSPPAKKRKSLTWRICYFLLCCIGAACLWYVWPVALVKPQFTISKETTYFTAPVDEEGYVNYQVALNEKVSQGVTVDNNAMVLLVKAIGPHPEGPGDLRDEFYQRLGIPRPPSEGNYLVRIDSLAKEKQWTEWTDPYVGDEWMKQVTQRPWKSISYPRIVEWLERNREPLSIIEEASRRPRYYAPMVFGPNAKIGQATLLYALLPFVQSFRNISNQLLARAFHAMDRKEYEAAWTDLRTILRLSKQIAQGPTLIELLVGLSLQRQVAEASNSLLEYPLPLPLLLSIQSDLKQLSPLTGIKEQVLIGERCMSLDLFLMMNRHGTGYMEVFGNGQKRELQPANIRQLNRLRNADWDTQLKRLNAWYDNLHAMVTIADYTEQQQKWDEFRVEITDMKQAIDKSRASLSWYFRSSEEEVHQVADIMMVMMTPAVEKVNLAARKSTQWHHLMQLSTCIALHRQQFGRYPVKLSELSPGPSPVLQLDLFSGKSLQYRRTDKGYELFSVGMNHLPQIVPGPGDAIESEVLPDADLVFVIPRPPIPIKGLESLTEQLDEFTFHLANCFLHPSAVAGGCSLPQLVLSMTSAHHLASFVPSDKPR